MTTIHTPNGQIAGTSAFKTQPPFVRSGQWIANHAWIAHETTGVFASLAQAMPRNGVYDVTQHIGIHQVGDTEPDYLDNYITRLTRLTVPVALVGPELETAVDENSLTDAMFDQRIEALTTDGRQWAFDATIVHATIHTHRWTWTVSLVRPVAALIGRDHRNRVRFAVAESIPPADEEAAS